MTQLTTSIKTVNHLNGRYRNDIARDIREGLSASQKYIPCKYFYDARGSKLFEEICRLPEYYLTRTEVSILQDIAPELMRASAHKDLVELGSGADWKIRLLLDAVEEDNRATLRYIPMDISESAIIETSMGIVERYPELDVLGVIADFTCQMDTLPRERPKMFCFLGSTIGNLDEHECITFLQNIASHMESSDTLLIGFDMVKDKRTLEAAYNDSQGVTAEFNKNILNVLNSELDSDFNPSHFDHLAFFNEAHNRIEMHLRANCECSAKLESVGMEVEIKKGETVHTENSRKFTRTDIRNLSGEAGLTIQNWHTDDSGWFSVLVMGRNTAPRV